MRTTKSFVEVIDSELDSDEPKKEAVAREILNARIAMKIVELREAAGLTQTQLADLANTAQPVIARLEDADYYGRSLTLLHRIAFALGCTLDISWERKVEHYAEVTARTHFDSLAAGLDSHDPGAMTETKTKQKTTFAMPPESFILPNESLAA